MFDTPTAAAVSRQDIAKFLGSQQTRALSRCPICSRADWEYYGGRAHFGVRLEYWICPGCCLVGQSPQLSAEVLGRFYSEWYRLLYQGAVDPADSELQLQQERSRHLLHVLKSQAAPDQPVTSLLDFGCSAGELLSVAAREFGVRDGLGIELDVVFSGQARRKGFHVFPTVEEAEQAGVRNLDLVTMSHVLEHLSDIVSPLAGLRNLLRERGLLCIEVPHTSEGACFQIAHLWGFNQSSLAYLLQTAGFEVLWMGTHGVPRDPKRNQLYLVAIAEKHVRLASAVRPSTPQQERMKRYLVKHPEKSPHAYRWMALKNTIKQLLGVEASGFHADSYRPSKLAPTS